MPDPNPSERLAEIEARYKGWIPMADWGPKCAGCGDDEYRIDGYCSVECRDYHSDEDISWLLEREKKLREALELISKRGQRYEHNTAEIGSVADCSDIARQALADSGEASGEVG